MKQRGVTAYTQSAILTLRSYFYRTLLLFFLVLTLFGLTQCQNSTTQSLDHPISSVHIQTKDKAMPVIGKKPALQTKSIRALRKGGPDRQVRVYNKVAGPKFQLSPKPKLPKATQLKAQFPKLLVGASGDYFPFNYIDSSGNLTGLDVELAQHFADALNIEVVFVDFGWPQLMTALAGGDFDLALSGINITDERKQKALFSTPYMHTGAVLVVPNKVLGSTTNDFDKDGFSLVVNQGGFLNRFAVANFTHAGIVTTTDNLSLADHVLQQKTTFVLTDNLEAPSIVRQLPGYRQVAPFTKDPIGALIQQDQTDLQLAFNAFLKSLSESGALDQMKRKYEIEP